MSNKAKVSRLRVEENSAEIEAFDGTKIVVTGNAVLALANQVRRMLMANEAKKEVTFNEVLMQYPTYCSVAHMPTVAGDKIAIVLDPNSDLEFYFALDKTQAVNLAHRLLEEVEKMNTASPTKN